MSYVQDWKDVTRKSYDAFPQDFAQHASIYRGKLRDWIYSFASEFAPKSRILDVGCGAGRDARFLTDYGLTIVGIDFSRELLKIAKKNVPSATFIEMDFETLDFLKESFDGAWASASLYHIPKKKLPNVLRKIYSVLKSNGVFFAVIREGNGEKMTDEQRGQATLKRFAAYYKPEELVTLFTGAGFKEVSYELDVVRMVPWIGVRARK